MFKSLPQEVAEHRTNLYNELVALIEPRLNPRTLSPFVTAETQRLAEYTATRMDIFLQALEAKAAQPAPMERLPALEFVPSPAQLPPSVVPGPITPRLPVIRYQSLHDRASWAGFRDAHLDGQLALFASWIQPATQCGKL
jgi:hypothetical protein